MSDPGAAPAPLNPVCELSDVIRLSGARGGLGVRFAAGGSWGVWHPPMPFATLHIVLAGGFWLSLPGQGAQRLHSGDLVWLPPGCGHGIASRPGAPMQPCDPAMAERVLLAGEEIQLGDAAADTRVLTLHYRHDPAVSTPGLLGLTAPMQLHALEHPALAGISRLLAAELARPQVGTAAAINSLIDLLLVQLMRAWLDARAGDPAIAPLGAALDPLLRDALAMIHREPARDWTTDSLARAVDSSRATLARRFSTVLGQTPGAYLTAWRMNLASLALRDSDEPVDRIARAVGYRSPHAFSRAFRRSRGASPSEYRLRVRAAPPTTQENLLELGARG